MQIYKITSQSNEKIKYLKKLNKKTERDKSGRFLAENLKIVHDALKSGFKPVSLFLTKELLNKKNKELSYILDKIDEYFVIDNKLNKYFSSLSTPSGIAAIYDKPKTKINLDKTIVYLNAINDPGNLGTILRTALAFNIKNIVVDENCADIYSSKTINAAKDAIFKLSIKHDTNLKIFNQIKNKMKIYATNLDEGKDINNFKKNKKSCIVLGNEANGVSKNILKKADDFIKINISDNQESLNVAIAAGIILYEIWEN